jgi:hypothetical protein
VRAFGFQRRDGGGVVDRRHLLVEGDLAALEVHVQPPEAGDSQPSNCREPALGCLEQRAQLRMGP